MQTRRRAAERWAEGEKIPRKLLLCGVSALLKMECFTNAAHTLDELDLPGFTIYKGLKGLDCELPGFVFHSLALQLNISKLVLNNASVLFFPLIVVTRD